MARWLEIVIAGLIAALLLAIEHWGPWQVLFRRKFHQTANYVLGVLAMQAPLSILLTLWGMWEALLAVWVITFMGGAVVLGCYAIDGWIDAKTRLTIAEQETRILRPGADDDQGSKAA